MYGHERRTIDYFVCQRDDAIARQHAYRSRHKNNRRRLFNVCSATVVGGLSICHVTESIHEQLPEIVAANGRRMSLQSMASLIARTSIASGLRTRQHC
jgi:hypothetical protein